MTSYKTLLAACVLLVACDGNPFLVEETPTDPGTGSGTDPGPGIDSDRVLPPGTASPSRSTGIFRREPTSENGGSTGDGYVGAVAYDRVTDTFTVDGLAFDGGNVYQRDNAVGSLGPFAVYEADSTFADDVTGTPIPQFGHRALYGVSRSGNTEFAIVRTGAYIPFGYGGFVYQRNGSVTLPTSGQASYAGDYAAIRDFDGAGGLEYAAGDLTISIDFNDFNDGAAVAGQVTNRAIFDVAGNDITDQVVAALNVENESALTALPTLLFSVGPGALDANGEMTGQLGSSVTGADGAVTAYEAGNYYAVISGDATQGGADEVVGIIVVEADDPRSDGVTVRESGGFILYRN